MAEVPSPESIADSIWEHAKTYNLRAGHALPTIQILHKMTQTQEVLNGEEYASGLNVLVSRKWIEGENNLITEEGFKNL